jgi:thioredoxin-like negative regulator of GroEL
MRLEYFTAEWCKPCKVFGPIMDQVTDALEIDMEKIDVEKSPDRVPADVMSMPTVIMYDGDKEVSRMIGARPEADVTAWIVRVGI